MFYQFVMAVSIWLSGLIVYLCLGCPPMSGLAMVGGAIWATGNLCTVPIIQSIGLAMGILLWGSTNMISGWFSGVFGFFGIAKQTADIKSMPLNIAGMVLCLCSVACSLNIKSETEGAIKTIHSVGSFTAMSTATGNLDGEGASLYSDLLPQSHVQEQSWIQRFSPTQKRICG